MFKISGYLLNLFWGLYGFYVYEYGDMSNGCMLVGEYFNFINEDYGVFDVEIRYVGDLGNIKLVGYNLLIEVNMMDNVMFLYGLYNIIGRSLVVYMDKDDLGFIDYLLSKIIGNFGGCLGCGIIVICKWCYCFNLFYE